MHNVFWIENFDGIEDHPTVPLAVVIRPEGGRMLEVDLDHLKRAGIETLVSLLEQHEHEELGLTEEGSLARKMGLTFLSHPIPDHQVPRDAGAFRAFVGDLAKRLRAGERVGVHCWGSIGRAPTVAACTLIELGWEAKAAMDAISLARSFPVPEMDEQREYVLNYRASSLPKR